MELYKKYSYDGPVFVYDKLVADHWKGETSAPTKTKAKSNLAYQYKMAHNLIPRTKVTLTGELTLVE